jgi:serine/threonine protein kinase
MKDCKRVRGFKPFFNIKHSDIKIGEALFGTHNIFSVLDKQNNTLPFIAKMALEINNNQLRYKKKKDIQNEVDIQSYAGLYGIAPKIYDFFVCTHNRKTYYTLLMENIEGMTLNDYLENENKISKNILIPLHIITDLKKRVKKSLDKLYDLGIRHDDMHGGNFIVTQNDIYIIDFGDVKLYKSKVPPTDRTYTISTNQGRFIVGKENPMVAKIKIEKIEKMKKVVNDAKIIGIQNDIKALEEKVKNSNEKMAGVFEKVIQQKRKQIEKLKV